MRRRRRASTGSTRGSSPAADLAIDAGELIGEPSTVVDVTGIDDGGGWRILREGALPAAEVDRELAAIASG